MSDQDIRSLQNECGVHICCSEAEGYGHYIAEAMSTGAVVLTTDGAPMNELIRPDCGMLIGVSESAETHAATKYLFGPQALGAAIAQLKSIPTSEKARMGQAAREWFLSNKAEFAPRFKAVIASCLKAGG